MFLIPPKAFCLPSRSLNLPWLTVFVSWLIPRLAVRLKGSPVFTWDTQAYLDLAWHIVSGNFEGYEALRTPGLPVLVILSAFNGHVIWFFHSVMVLVASTVIFILASHETRNPWVGCVTAVALNLSYLIFYESYLMTEIGTLFFVTLALFFSTNHLPRSRVSTPTLVGMLLAGALLMRPSALGIVPAFVFWMGLKQHTWITRFIASGFTLAPVMAAWIGWAAVNAKTTGTFDYSVNTGISLAGHSGPLLVRYRPAEWEHVSKIYVPLHLQREMSPQHGVYYDAVWDTIVPLQHSLHLDFRGVERLWLRTSLALFCSHPVDYLVSVVNALPSFFCHYKCYAFFEAPSQALRYFIHLHGFEMTAINFLAVVASAVWLFKWLFAGGVRRFEIRQLLALILIEAALFHAMLIPYALSRHGIPYSGIACLAAGLASWDLLVHKFCRSKK